MIISASRRTDIPSYYSDWFYNRIKEGFVLVRNPMNFHQISQIKLTPDVVDGIVFWTKNPVPMLKRLDELKKYNIEYHIKAFKDIAEELHDYTRKVTISFIDVDYRGVKSNIKELALFDFPNKDQIKIGSALANTQSVLTMNCLRDCSIVV